MNRISVLLLSLLNGASCYILQLSDMHVSLVNQASSHNLLSFCKDDFNRFLSKELEAIVITGDMVDGTPELFSMATRSQIEGEWKALTEAFSPCVEKAKLNNIPIFSLRGNHDAFGVARFQGQGFEYYKQFNRRLPSIGVSYASDWVDGSAAASECQLCATYRGSDKFVKERIKAKSNSNYLATGVQTFLTRDGTTAVVLLDNCYLGGTSRHFYGVFQANTTDEILTQIGLLEALKPNKVTRTIIFSHYPTGTFKSADRAQLFAMFDALNSAGKTVTGFHAGHLHTGLGYPLHEKHGNVIEWEVPDFKARRTVRVIAGTNWDLVADFRIVQGWHPVALSILPDRKGLIVDLQPIGPLHIAHDGAKGKDVEEYGFKALSQSDILLELTKFADTEKTSDLAVKRYDDSKTKPGNSKGTLSTDANSIPMQQSEIVDFRGNGVIAWIMRFVFVRVPEIFLSVSILLHVAYLFLALFLYAQKSTFFHAFNLISNFFLPLLPLCLMQVEPGNVGVVFWWGAVIFSPFGFRANDTSALGIIGLQAKALIITSVLLGVRKYPVTKIPAALIIVFLQYSIFSQFLIRGGPLGLLGYPLIWDCVFWATSGYIKWRKPRELQENGVVDSKSP